ncbi:hypothetical protein G3I78_36540 [Streptomyces sp. SID13726]|nr:hypothetical protein [Streptomyces sp. SID13726]
MGTTSGKGGAPKGKPAVPPPMVSNTVRDWLLSRPLSEAARAVVEGAEWVEGRNAWALDLSPETADELGMATLSRLDA